MLNDRECLVVRCIGDTIDRYASVAVGRRGWAVINRNGRVVFELPACSLEFQAEGHVLADLCSARAKPMVEAGSGYCSRPVAHVTALEEVDLSRRTHPQVMVANSAPEPLHLPYDISEGQAVALDQVTPPQPAEFLIGREGRRDSRRPVFMRHRVVVDERHDVASRFSERRIPCRDQPGSADNQPTDRQRPATGTTQELLGLHIVRPMNDENFIRRPTLASQALETAVEGIRSAPCRHHDGEGQLMPQRDWFHDHDVPRAGVCASRYTYLPESPELDGGDP